jgi:ribonuclease HII
MKSNHDSTGTASKRKVHHSNVSMEFEDQASTKGYKYICGVDEAGRGPLAGPVVAAAVILPTGFSLTGLDDSKRLTSSTRSKLFDLIYTKAIAIGTGISEVNTIDEVNILQATYRAMRQAINMLPKADFVLVDGWKIPELNLPQINIIGGDAISSSIAAASIIAKVMRDRLMIEYDKLYPQYRFSKNKGYCTLEHIEAVKRYGLSPIHRTSFHIPDIYGNKIALFPQEN